MRRRIVTSLCGSLAVLALAATTASAAETIKLGFGADPTEEVPLPISVTWTSSDPEPSVFVTVKPAGGLGCAANYAADDENSDDVIYASYLDSPAPSGSLSENHTFANAGGFVVCGYLQHRSSDATPRAVTSAPLTVRAARAVVSLSVPARVRRGKLFVVSATLTAELARELFVTVKPAGGRRCEPTYSLDSPNSDDVIFGEEVQGTRTATSNLTASRTRGVYLLCAYIQEGSDDPTPEAAASRQFVVGPDQCSAARGALSAAKKRARNAAKSTRRARAAAKRYRRLARRTQGSSRLRYRRLAARADGRYRRALHGRAKARRKVADRSAAVVRRCPAR